MLSFQFWSLLTLVFGKGFPQGFFKCLTAWSLHKHKMLTHFIIIISECFPFWQKGKDTVPCCVERHWMFLATEWEAAWLSGEQRLPPEKKILNNVTHSGFSKMAVDLLQLTARGWSQRFASQHPPLGLKGQNVVVSGLQWWVELCCL